MNTDELRNLPVGSAITNGVAAYRKIGPNDVPSERHWGSRWELCWHGNATIILAGQTYYDLDFHPPSYYLLSADEVQDMLGQRGRWQRA